MHYYKMLMSKCTKNKCI